jgi:hypothetical protein
MNTDQKIIKNKVGLLNLAEMLGSVSEACKVIGYSRDSFYPKSGSSVVDHESKTANSGFGSPELRSQSR